MRKLIRNRLLTYRSRIQTIVPKPAKKPLSSERKQGRPRPLTDGKLQCLDCQEWKPAENFYARIFDGLLHYDSRCDPCRKLNYKLRNRGMTLAQYKEMAARAAGKCMICHLERPLGIDHCHRTDKYRGLLCQACNSGLACFQDNVDILRSAIEYLDISVT